LEAADGEAEKPGSLLDHLTEGIVSNTEAPTAGQYIPSLLTTQPGTHTLETILTSSSERIFTSIWSTYFVGKIGKLAGHPTANYVIARAVGRLGLEELQGVMRECRAVAGGKGMISELRGLY
jgi:nucleolar protein 9